MNKLDAELALSALRRAGYEEAATPEEADVVLYNTCSVRAHAEERVYSNVGKLKSLKRRKPRLVIGILGCMAQKDGEKIFERLPHVDLVCGTREFPRIAELIEEARRAGRVLACSEDAPVSEAREISVRPDRRRAFLGIMRGCDNYCAYCVVPYVRGPEISRPVEEVVDEAKRLADDGAAARSRCSARTSTATGNRSARRRPRCRPFWRGWTGSPGWRGCGSSPRIRRTCRAKSSKPSATCRRSASICTCPRSPAATTSWPP